MRKINFKLTLSSILVLSFITILGLSSCGKNNKTTGDEKKLDDQSLAKVDTSGAVTGDWIIIRELADAQGLNPITTNDASADEIDSYVYETLNNVDQETFELIPLVADLPTVSDDHLTYTYHMKKNVYFSDGQPMTGEDVVFNMKAIKNPFVDDAALRNYFEMVKKVEVDPSDPYTVRIIMSRPYWRALYSNGSFRICPKHVLDPQGLTDKMSWDELTDMKSAKNNPSIQKFADFINSQEVSRENKYVLGSGPYMLESWKTGQAITIKRNPKYWDATHTPAYSDKIIFKTIQDNSASVVSAKNKEIDAMFVISPVDFYKNLENAEQFDLIKAKPIEPTYTYLAWNEVSPLFKDAKVRMALSYCVDRKDIIDKVLYGDAVPIQSHIYFKNAKLLNTDLPPIPFDLEKAKQLLSEAGWKDSDGDGVLDKVIDGKKTDFKFTFLILNNPIRKQVLLVVIDALKKVGIRADLQELEWSVYLDKTKKHEYEATYGAWQLSVTPEDPYQIWHSSQAQGEGSNYISFINAQSDSLIEAYRNEFDENKRVDLIKRWQKLIYEQQPYTFLWSSKSRYIYNSRYKNARWYSKSPSPTYNEWWVPKGSQKYTPNSQM
ncbi:MAG: ABC transporter substrate-binding protein [Ignavibacteria bacterium]